MYMTENTSKTNLKRKILIDARNSTAKTKKLDEKMGPSQAVTNQVENYNDSVTMFPDVVKSANDKKNYRAIELNNGLRLLLISDPHGTNERAENVSSVSSSESEYSESDDEEFETSGDDESENQPGYKEDEDSQDIQRRVSKHGEKLAAASLCIAVGSFSDPPDLPGLAHFLEHMVFMGSDKYPQENAFDEFVKMHGGNSNASTDCEFTTFEFEIHQRHFCDALKCFAQFFACPLLRPESMKREKEAIDSEFQMALPSDLCRKQQLFAQFAKPGHPVSKFTWGNSTTLNLPNDLEGTELNKRVRQFWEEHYTANRMTLALQSKCDLDTMEEWGKSIFQNLPRGHRCKPSFESFGEPFDVKDFNKLIKVVPVKSINQVCLQWALPSQLKHYRIKPLNYLSFLIGHEGKGSLLAYLRKKVWALALESGNDESGFEHSSVHALFGINISLTEQGMDNLEHVIQAVFQYIMMLQQIGPNWRIWQEIQTVAELSFRYVEDCPSVEYVEILSENMQLYPPHEYITGDTLFSEYNPEIISECMNSLRPDNVNIMVLSKNFVSGNICNQTEPWFKTQFAAEDIPEKWLDLWFSRQPNPFCLPDPNPYLPTNFSLLELPSNDEDKFKYPIKISGPNDNFSLWYRQDTKFRTPKAILLFYLMTPVIAKSPESVAMMELLVNILKLQLMEETYDAIVAQLEFSITTEDRGMIVKTCGFNDKLHLLTEVIATHIVNCWHNLEEEVFSAMKEDLRRSYKNFCLKPSKLVRDARLTILHTSHWSAVDKFNSLDVITLAAMKEFIQEFIASIQIQSLIQGNYSQEQALKVVRNFKEKLKTNVTTTALAPVRICQIPLGTKYCRIKSFNKNDNNSVVVNYYQSGPTNIKHMCIMEAIVTLMEEPVFDILRTQEQLGYDVNVILRNTYGILGFSVSVHFQSDKFSASYIDERIEKFMEIFQNRLSTMSDSELETRLLSLIKLKQRPDVSLEEEVSRFWNEIINDELLFDRLEQEVSHLQEITLADIRQFLNQHIATGDKSNFRKLSMQVVGMPEKCDNDAPDSESQLTLTFHVDSEESHGFIKDLHGFRKCCYIYSPMKSYNGLEEYDQFVKGS